MVSCSRSFFEETGNVKLKEDVILPTLFHVWNNYKCICTGICTNLNQSGFMEAADLHCFYSSTGSFTEFQGWKWTWILQCIAPLRKRGDLDTCIKTNLDLQHLPTQNRSQNWNNILVRHFLLAKFSSSQERRSATILI